MLLTVRNIIFFKIEMKKKDHLLSIYYCEDSSQANKMIPKSLLATENVLEHEGKSVLVSSRQGHSRVRNCFEENVSREEQCSAVRFSGQMFKEIWAFKTPPNFKSSSTPSEGKNDIVC